MADGLLRLTPLQLRTELEEMVLKDLLGPAGGPTEIVTEHNVRGGKCWRGCWS
ncbi:hypothetical protein ANRL4_04021 [Anaerolineae bacterium]|nr:hypothetical protein ANRL4_04021 [Anaerolineae bacterium]